MKKSAIQKVCSFQNLLRESNRSKREINHRPRPLSIGVLRF